MISLLLTGVGDVDGLFAVAYVDLITTDTKAHVLNISCFKLSCSKNSSVIIGHARQLFAA